MVDNMPTQQSSERGTATQGVSLCIDKTKLVFLILRHAKLSLQIPTPQKIAGKLSQKLMKIRPVDLSLKHDLIWYEIGERWLITLPSRKKSDHVPMKNPPDDSVMDYLIALLLSEGGTDVLFDKQGDPPIVLALSLIDERPIFNVGTNLTLFPMEAGNCHENIRKLRRYIPRAYKKASGFVLANGIWLRHSWLTGEGGQILETTTPLQMYWGGVNYLEMIISSSYRS